MAEGIYGDCPSHYWIEDDGRGRYVTIDKPPYRVPLMEEIRQCPPNGFKVVSTFAGGGGSTTGYKMAGFDVIWANEFLPAAQATYAANHPDTILDGRSIHDLTAEDILTATGLKAGELDLFDGSPPCQSFSTAGKREKKWGVESDYGDGLKQRNDDLFFEYTRILRGLQPKVFVAENVSGLVKGVAKGYFKIILRALRGCGYTVEAKLLDAQWLGVPQARQRIIFIGVRNDLDALPAFPVPLPYRYSVRDAIGVSASNKSYSRNNWSSGEKPHTSVLTSPLEVIVLDDGYDGKEPRSLDEPASTIRAGRALDVVSIEGANGFNGHAYQSVDTPAATVPPGRSLRVETNRPEDGDLGEYAIGKEWDKLKPGGQSDKYRSLVKLDPEKPSPTATDSGGGASVASITHPTERRKLTIAELKRICSFPDDYILTGSYADQWERCGNSVPPVMMASIAAVIRDRILAEV